MNTQNQIDTNNVIDVFNLSELSKSNYVNEWADNFGYNHLVKKELERWVKYDASFYIMKADRDFNYGLDFTIMASFNLNGKNIIQQVTFGGVTITFN